MNDLDGKPLVVKETVPDKVIRYFNPTMALRRMQSRTTMALLGGFTGASRSDRSMKGWRTTQGASPDDDIILDLPTLRDRSRDSARNHPVGASIINTMATNVIGPGFVFHSRLDREFLKLSDAQAEQREAQIEREWRFYSKTKNVCLSKRSNIDELADIAFRQYLENGESFVMYPWRERPGEIYATKIQLVEADRVCNKEWAADSDILTAGILRDVDGVPEKYHVADRHPLTYKAKGIKWTEVPAFSSSGRRMVNHVYKPTRPDQSRGVPFLAPVLIALKQITRYTDAELMAAIVSGMFTVFIKTEAAAGSGIGLGNFTPGVVNDQTTTTTGQEDYKLGNGAIVGLNANQSIESANPMRPNSVFDSFVLAILRQIGAALEIPFEILIKHFTSSYSASRAAMLEAWRFFSVRRKWFIENFYIPSFEIFMDEAVARERVIAPGFFEDLLIRQAYLAGEWIGAPRGMIDEEKELNAAEKKISLTLSTKQTLTSELTGGDYEQNVKQRGKEQKLEKANLEPPKEEKLPFGKQPSDKKDPDENDKPETD
jgi:lambda family phage portal protein